MARLLLILLFSYQILTALALPNTNKNLVMELVKQNMNRISSEIQQRNQNDLTNLDLPELNQPKLGQRINLVEEGDKNKNGSLQINQVYDTETQSQILSPPIRTLSSDSSKSMSSSYSMPSSSSYSMSSSSYSTPVTTAYTAPVTTAYTAPVTTAYTAPVTTAYTAPITTAYTAPITTAQSYTTVQASQSIPVTQSYVNSTPSTVIQTMPVQQYSTYSAPTTTVSSMPISSSYSSVYSMPSTMQSYSMPVQYMNTMPTTMQSYSMPYQSYSSGYYQPTYSSYSKNKMTSNSKCKRRLIRFLRQI